MIRHHPADDFLLAYAAGRLPTGHAIVAASHVEACAQCRARVDVLEAAAGAMLENLPPAPLAVDALARTLAAIDAAAPGEAAPSPSVRQRAALPGGLPLPRALAGCEISRWYWTGPGMYFSRVKVPYDPAANLFLLRIGRGRMLPRHTHSHSELTQVLYGAFDDGRAVFAPGDFDETDDGILHQPTVQGASECICLASVEGKVVFEGVLARTMGALLGM